MAESKAIIDLVNKAKAGNDEAFESLYFKYRDMISGSRMALALGRQPNAGAVDEDFASICRLLFVEAVLRYDPKKSKLSTYITNYIRWTFTSKMLKERMIKISRKQTPEATVGFLEKTTVIPVEKAFFNDHFKSSDVIELRLKNSDELFIIVDKNCLAPTLLAYVNAYNANVAEVYKYYLEGILEQGMSHSRAVKFASIKSEINGCTTTRAIKEASKYLKENLEVHQAIMSPSANKKVGHAD